MGTRLMAGRFFDEQDKPGQGRIIIDETLAARAWPGENAVGKRLQVQPTGSRNPYAEIIGVVEHIRAHDVARSIRPQIYTVIGAVPRMYVVIRATESEMPPAAAIVVLLVVILLVNAAAILLRNRYDRRW